MTAKQINLSKRMTVLSLIGAVLVFGSLAFVGILWNVNGWSITHDSLDDSETQYEKPHTTVTVPIDEHRQLEIDVDKWNQDVAKYESNYGGY